MDPATMAALAQYAGNSWQNQKGGYATLFDSIFNNPATPWKHAQKSYNQYADQAQDQYQPWVNAGKDALGNYTNWLDGQKDPSGFINSLMSQYQQSPQATYLQHQAQNAGNNAASASGMLGSTPFLQQSQENAGNIASQDMHNWLSQVLGINQQYGAGEQGLMTQGNQASNALAQFLDQRGMNAASFQYNRDLGNQKRSGGIFSGLLNILG